MKTLLKILLSSILVVIILLFCDTLSVVLAMGIMLVYIWDETDKKEKEETEYEKR